MREKKTIKILSKIYLLLLLVYISTIFIYPFGFFTGINDGYWLFFNLTVFIFGGYIGLPFLFISYYYISKYKLLRFLLMSIIGSIALGINYGYMFYFDYQDNIYIEPFFQFSMNFFVNLGFWILLITYNFLLVYIYFRKKNHLNEFKLRKIILDRGKETEILTLKELCAESDNYDIYTIRVIKDMIKNKQINGEYFKVTKTIQFNVQENLVEIDRLMAIFEEWEKLNLNKK